MQLLSTDKNNLPFPPISISALLRSWIGVSSTKNPILVDPGFYFTTKYPDLGSVIYSH